MTSVNVRAPQVPLKTMNVVWRGKRTAVMKVTWRDGLVSYDMWEWKVFRLKWIRQAHAGGFGMLKDAQAHAEKRDKEIEDMLIANQTVPPPLP
jgi:hypothetical protein